jgi:hypothetical protein
MVHVEILLVGIDSAGVWAADPGSAVMIEFDGQQDPSAVAAREIEQRGHRPEFVHSTSWRWEPEGLVVTYLAVESARVSSIRVSAGSAGTWSNDPRVGVLLHGLRHLAFLARLDRNRFPPSWNLALSEFEPGLAGEIRSVRAPD